MARLMGIDYGGKRTGIAVTDRLQIIATGLCTVATNELMPFLENYCKEEEVECFVLGDPHNLDGSATHATPLVAAFKKKLKKKFPETPIELVDESFTSKMAMQTLIASGVKKMKRRNKALLDEVSATLILKSYMEQRENEQNIIK